MTVVGLTGGIGSGKTTVAKQFKDLGIPVYIADEAAKQLMCNSKIIKLELLKLFGNDVFIDHQLNKPFIRNIIYNDASYLQKMNAIVHPEVAKHFKKWVLKQDAPYVIKEVAILFENDGYKQCDIVITVTAPKKIRIKRLLKRDGATIETIESIMNNQWTDAQKVKLSQFVITNTALEKTKIQVGKIHQEILKVIT